MKCKYFILLTLIFSFVALTAGAAVSPIGSGMETPTIPEGHDGCKDAGSRGTVTVGPGVTYDFNTIQAAIDDAGTLAGDVIEIAAGTYTQSIIVSKALTLTGAPGAAASTIIAGTTSTAVTITADGVTITWLKVTNPAGKNGIHSSDHSNLTISNCIVTNVGSADTSTSGTNFGIAVLCSAVAVDGITITDNEVSAITGGDGKSADGIAIGWSNGALNFTNVLIKNNTIFDIDSSTADWPAGHGAYGIIINHTTGSATGQTIAPIICNNTIYDVEGLWATGIGLEGKTPDAEVKGNWIDDLTHHKTTPDAQAVKLEDNDAADTVEISYNSFTNVELGVANYVGGSTVNAEKNWWGTTDSATIAGMVYGAGSVDYSPYLLTNQIRMAFLGNRLADMQYTNGGWGWPLTAPPTYNNIHGPITMGLAKAYRATGDPDLLPALQAAGTFFLTKTNNFSTPDGYMAAELDALLGGSTYTDHVWNNFYTPLANGIYDRNGLGTLYDTAGYVQWNRDNRASQGIPNLAAWDLGMGLMAAATAGVSGSDLDDWIAGVKAEIDDLDGSDDFDVIGLAGALYGLAFVGEEFDPTAGEHAAADSLADLADILVSYQITETGGFARNSNYVLPYECNEWAQETSYAILALAELGGYESEITAAYDYLLSVQFCTGGWENGCSTEESGENNEVGAEGGWALWASEPSELTLVPDSDCYFYEEVLGVPVTEVSVELWMTDVAEDIVGGQFFLNYDDSQLSFESAASEGLFYNLYLVSSTPGELDYAVQINPPDNTTGDTLIATLTFTALNDICNAADLITWRTHNPPTRLSDAQGQPIYPDLMAMDVIDNVAPVISCPGPATVECSDDALPATTGMATADDNCDEFPVIDYSDDISGLTGCNGTGTFTRTWTADDFCGNVSTCDQVITVVDTTAPEINCPGPATVECSGDWSPTATGTATANDNCGGAVTPTWSDDTSGLTGCNGTGTFIRIWTAQDACGNSNSCPQTITVVDTTAPEITVMPDIEVLADAGGCDAMVTWPDPVVTDNCGTLPTSFLDGFEADPYVAGDGDNWNEYNSTITRVLSGTNGITSKSGAAHGVIDSSTLPLGSTGAYGRLGGYSSEFGNGFTASLDVYMDLTDPAVATTSTYGWDLATAVSNQSGTHRRDFIFHTASYEPGHILVGGSNNTNDPVGRREDLAGINHYDIITSGWYTFGWDFHEKSDGTLEVDLNLYDSSGTLLWTETRNNTSDVIATEIGGNRYMWFTFLAVDTLAIDNTTKTTNGNITVTVAPPSGSVFPQGDTTVLITATDDCGRVATSTFDVTVSGDSEMVVDLALGGTVTSPTTRCITFELFDCGVGTPTVVQEQITFTGGSVTGHTMLVPCGNYTCVTARDELHTLRRTLDGITVSGTQYVASFTNPLIGGNLNDDEWIDILDFGVFSWQFGPGGGDTNCFSSYPHADINGDGTVDTLDFTFIQINFLDTHDTDCCVILNPLGGSQPVVSVSVQDLIARGLGHLAAGDLNSDGWLDQADVIAFMQGARPDQLGVGGVKKPLMQNQK